MYRDNTLIPSEAIRLLALGLLAERPQPYGELALAVRRFVGLLVGPSLDLLAPPLELLKIEGLVVAENGEPEAPLRLTAEGGLELRKLLGANARAPNNDLSKLILSLKVRFIGLLPAGERRTQAELLVEVVEREQARLAELVREAGSDGSFAGWAALELAQAEQRLAWLRTLRSSL